MSGVLIDTNIYSLAMRGEPEIVRTLQATSHIGFSVISVGELLSGFKGGNREAETNLIDSWIHRGSSSIQ